MIHVITFTNNAMTISAEKLVKSASEKIGNCSTKIYYPEDFGQEFYDNNKDVLNSERGGGYWLWKPYIILKTLQYIPANDILIYCDAGLLFEQNISGLLKQMNQDIYLFGNKYKHGNWCKRDCLELMNANTDHYIHHGQAQASVVILKKTKFAFNFIKEWLLFGQMPNLIDDSPSILQNIPEFQEHRHDQAILTNLAIKYKIKLHWWAVKYMLRHQHKYPKDNNQVIWLHHRKRNNEW